MVSISYVVYKYYSEGLFMQNLYQLDLTSVGFPFVPDLTDQIMHHEVSSSKCGNILESL